jgi:hypothetical protein
MDVHMPHPQNIHVGMVLLPELPPDPVAHSHFFSREGTEAWNIFFKPNAASAPTVNIPAEWVDFLTDKLLSPEYFPWAKSLLQSNF